MKNDEQKYALSKTKHLSHLFEDGHYTLKEAQVVIESWRCHYNTLRPHSALGYRPPAPHTRTIDNNLAMIGKAA